MRLALIRTVGIRSTISDAFVGLGITVRLVGYFTSINGSTLLSSRASRTGVATSVSATIGGSSRAIGVNGTRSTGSVGLASGLVRYSASIEVSAIGIGSASPAAPVSLAVSSASGSQTTSVIVGISVTLIRINANTVVANCVCTHRERSIVADTGSIVGARSTSAVFVAVRVSATGSIVRASVNANTVGSAERRSTSISTPGVGGSAISVVTACQTDTVGHAVSTLGSSAVSIAGAISTSSDAETRSLVAVYLAGDFTTIQSSTSRRGIVNTAAHTVSIGLTVLASANVFGKIAISICVTREGRDANSGGDVAGALTTKIQSSASSVTNTGLASSISLTISAVSVVGRGESLGSGAPVVGVCLKGAVKLALVSTRVT